MEEPQNRVTTWSPLCSDWLRVRKTYSMTDVVCVFKFDVNSGCHVVNKANIA